MKTIRIIFTVFLAVVLLAGPALAADQRIQSTEEMVGAGHGTKADTLNRLTLVEHDSDGTHNATAVATLKALGIRSLPTGHLSGLALSNGTDTDHDVDVAVGKVRDEADAIDISVAAMTKQFDAVWAAGSAAGGMLTGNSLPTSGTIHVFATKVDASGLGDVFACDNATAGITPIPPAGCTGRRHIGSYRTDGSDNILDGDWYGTGRRREIVLDTAIRDVASATPGTSAVTAALSTPGGVVVKANVNVAVVANVAVYLSSLASADMVPSETVAPLCNSYDRVGGQGFSVYTNTSSQIRHRSDSNVAIYIATLGWVQDF